MSGGANKRREVLKFEGDDGADDGAAPGGTALRRQAGRRGRGARLADGGEGREGGRDDREVKAAAGRPAPPRWLASAVYV
eukprot:COSAG02_NODE_3289_length_6998_cov_24.766488_6_plen_80_part_00